MWWIGFHAVLFWFLFWDFYVNTYLARSSAGRKKRKDGGSDNSSNFFACTQTEAFINGINRELDELHESSKANGYTSSVMKESKDRKEGKDL